MERVGTSVSRIARYRQGEYTIITNRIDEGPETRINEAGEKTYGRKVRFQTTVFRNIDPVDSDSSDSFDAAYKQHQAAICRYPCEWMPPGQVKPGPGKL